MSRTLFHVVLMLLAGGAIAVAIPELQDALLRREAGLQPAADTTTSEDPGWARREIVLEPREGGHFVTDVTVNGADIRFLVDTGATGIALSREDAARAGITGPLRFTKRVNTANGVTRSAPVTLRRVRLQQLELYDVHAEVIEGDLGISLLGMSFLRRLEGYRVENGRLVLSW